MNKLLLLLSFGFGAVITVPYDFITIQGGIDGAAEGDTVVVYPDLYNENIVIDKSITLTSLALFDTTTNTIAESLDNWVDFTSVPYNVIDEYINTTIINGAGEDKSTVTVKADDCIEPLILGFTIQNGSGTLVDRKYDGNTVAEYIGGGIVSFKANPTIHYNKIYNNGGLSDIRTGGAVYSVTTDDDVEYRDSNRDCDNDSFDYRHNFFENNTSSLGRHIGNRFDNVDFDLSNCIFDKWNCQDEGVYQTPIWVNIDDIDNLVAEDEENSGCLLTGDVYVDPVNGDDDLNDGSEGSPFYTITNTLPKVVGTPTNPVTINLAEGTFSPSTNGESFPIELFSHVNLIGAGEEVTIIDAEETDRVIIIEDCDNNIISDLTITGGEACCLEENYGDGSGMYIWDSNPILTNVTITDNTAYSGGGMWLYKSNSILTNVTITDNTATYGGGGGMWFSNSDPILTHVTISNNTAGGGWGSGGGGGMLLNYSNPTLTNVTITDNMANGGGGMFLESSNPTLTHVTIAHNTANGGGGMYINTFYGSSPILTNSIFWDNDPESIYFPPYSNEEPVISYSNIEGGWEGEGNIDLDPLFTDPESGNFTLQTDSPCIDTGDPNIWYNDIDMTRADMGITGGLYATPNFTSHNFGEVGDIGSNMQFTLYNYRETPITISEVEFSTVSFTTNTSFPITIEPLETGIVNIDANNSFSGFIQDEMQLISEDLPEDISVSLLVTGMEGNILTGNLSGTYPVATYRISGDLTIADGNTAYIHAGTEFLFDGQYNFNIYGTLKAIGTESDSIIFDNYGDERWSGFTLENASDATEFSYVRISGSDGGVDGGGMQLVNSNPILTHVTISNNQALHGGGMYLYVSNPILTHVTISNNTAEMTGGGMRLYYSNPTLTNVTIANNTADLEGGGMFLGSSNPILTNVTITNNTGSTGGGMDLIYSDPILTNSIIWGNSPQSIYLHDENEPLITFSDIEGGFEGEGNINLDPLFINIENNEYYLGNGSPCIDAGIPLTGECAADPESSDYEELNEYCLLLDYIGCLSAVEYGVCINWAGSEYCGSAPDMGAYEYCEEECGAELGDVNGDSEINILDLVQIANLILEVSTPTYECAADYTGDGQVNILDLVQIANYIISTS